jgi:hypothetical protein
MDARSQADDRKAEHFWAVIAVVLAGVIQVSSSAGPFGPWNVMIGIVLISVLLTYRVRSNLQGLERVTLATTWGFILISTTGWGWQETYRFAQRMWPTLPNFQSNGEAPGIYYLVLWLIMSSIAFFILRQLSAPQHNANSDALSGTMGEQPAARKDRG